MYTKPFLQAQCNGVAFNSPPKILGAALATSFSTKYLTTDNRLLMEAQCKPVIPSANVSLAATDLDTMVLFTSARFPCWQATINLSRSGLRERSSGVSTAAAVIWFKSSWCTSANAWVDFMESWSYDVSSDLSASTDSSSKSGIGAYKIEKRDSENVRLFINVIRLFVDNVDVVLFGAFPQRYGGRRRVYGGGRGGGVDHQGRFDAGERR